MGDTIFVIFVILFTLFACLPSSGEIGFIIFILGILYFVCLPDSCASSISIESYNKATNYCVSNSMTPIYIRNSGGGVVRVECQTSNGIKFKVPLDKY